MKRGLKLVLEGTLLLLTTILVTGCTASFCRDIDKAHMLYAYDYGITDYYASKNEAGDNIAYYYDSNNVKTEIEGIYYTRNLTKEFNKTIVSINETASKQSVSTPSDLYWETLDAVFLGYCIEYTNQIGDTTFTTLNKPEVITRGSNPYKDEAKKELKDKGILETYGYLKYFDTKNEKAVLWTNFYTLNDRVRVILNGLDRLDDCASNDYLKLYVSTLTQNIANNRSCLATKDGSYGAYGQRGMDIEIQTKGWTDWNGLLEFLFVWPIGALIDVLVTSFGAMGAGLAAVTAIFIVTLIVRSLMLIFTFKQTAATAKMNELQPEISKIQAKYPNANTSTSEKQRMSMEMQKLYKKNGINPLSSILVLIIQFPVFICVWGALQGSAALSSGSLLGLRLSDSIGSIMFNGASWSSFTAGGPVALILFILMGGTQAVAMLLPQWIQKKREKNFVKLGKNPAKASQNNKMKWFTYIMLAMIIIMGYSLASGMGVYWLVGACFSIAQTLITNKITTMRKQKGR